MPLVSHEHSVEQKGVMSNPHSLNRLWKTPKKPNAVDIRLSRVYNLSYGADKTSSEFVYMALM